MSRHLITPILAAALALAIALLSGGEWPAFVFGALFALVLWVILFFGVAAKDGAVARTVPWPTYAVAAVFALGLGYVFYRLGDGNGAWWGPAVIMAGVLAPQVPGAVDRAPETG